MDRRGDISSNKSKLQNYKIKRESIFFLISNYVFVSKLLVVWTDQCRESSCLGTSCVVPGPKTVHPKEPNHFRPVALTSHLMKTMERIILRHLRPLVGTLLDPLQSPQCLPALGWTRQ